MSKNYLLLVEGEEEVKLFSSLLKKEGFNAISKEERVKFELIDASVNFDKEKFSKDLDNVLLVVSKNTRLHDLLKKINSNDSIEKVFKESVNSLNGVFLIFDVDHNDENDINQIFEIFNDESEGLLLLNSPCLEVIADLRCNYKEQKFYHLKEYKAQVHNTISLKSKSQSFIDYLIDHIYENMLFFLNKNTKEFNEPNIMEHPYLIKEFINKHNKRVNNPNESYVIYRYYSTVLYVFLAFIKGLTIQINNFKIVKEYLEKRIKFRTI